MPEKLSKKGYDIEKEIVEQEFMTDEEEEWNGIYKAEVPCFFTPNGGFLTIMATFKILESLKVSFFPINFWALGLTPLPHTHSLSKEIL